MTHKVSGDSPHIIYYNGNTRVIAYQHDGRYHREDGPAYIEYYESGNIKEESYYIMGERHRVDGPAIVKYYENGNIDEEWYYQKNDTFRNEDYEVINYYLNGNVKRKYSYNDICKDPSNPKEVQYHLNGNIKYTLVVLFRGSGSHFLEKEYYDNGNIRSEKYHWGYSNYFHKPDGPAVVYYDINGNIEREEFWFAGESYKDRVIEYLLKTGYNKIES